MSMGVKPPTCCGRDAVWVNMGPKLEYWYCRECKKEVAALPKPKLHSSDNEDIMREFDEAYEALFGDKKSPPPDSFLTTGFPRLAKRGELDDDFEEFFNVDDTEELVTYVNVTDPTTYEGAD